MASPDFRFTVAGKRIFRREQQISTPLKTTAYRAGGLLMVIGAALPLFAPAAAPYVFALGTLLFAPAQMANRYEGGDIVMKRLRRQQLMAALLLLVTAGLMLMARYGVRPLRGNEWMATLAVAAFLEVYTVFRIAHEEKRKSAK